MASKADQGPPSWSDALGQASSILAQGLQAPDADIKFGVALIGAMSAHNKKSGGAGAGAPGMGAPAGGDAGSPPGSAPAGPPGAAAGGGPGGPAGGGAPNPAMASGAAPGGPVPGGMTPGLSPNPDELRRVLADVAGK